MYNLNVIWSGLDGTFADFRFFLVSMYSYMFSIMLVWSLGGYVMNKIVNVFKGGNITL